jgi:multidrug resistance protein MdtO
MTRNSESVSGGPGLSAWLREELAPRPGRLAAVVRIAASCALAVAVAMAFQIPLPAYVVYLVFVISRPESVATLITAVGVAIGATLAVALSLVLLTVDAGNPALRLPLMAGVAFLTMFLARVSRLGPLAYLVGFIMVLTQTLVDTVPSPEMLTRLVLWLWVVVMVPAVTSTLVNLVFGEDPAELARQTALRLLDAVTATLDGRPLPELARQQTAALGLVALRKDAQIADRQLRERAEVDHRLIETLVELLTLLRAIPPDLPRDVRNLLVQASEECRLALASAGAPMPGQRPVPPALLDGLAADTLPIVVAIDGALRRLGNDIARRRDAGESPPARTPTKLTVPDAWSNPEHARFALKTTIAVMAAYFIYTVLDWPGISTAVPTCFVVAMGSMGETIHKMWLRICGALIGGLAAGLCIVFLLPHMTDIGQLCLLVAAASGICAWVATSSERLAYMGMQMALAFLLGMLQGYGPNTSLTVLWDRVVGILLGNLLMSVVFTVFWPISALDRSRAAIAQALRALGTLVRDAVHPPADARLAAVRRLVEARQFTLVAAFEANPLPGHARRESLEEAALARLDRLATAVFVVAGQSSDQAISQTSRIQDAAAAAWFADAAQSFAAATSAPAAPGPARVAETQAVLPGVGQSSLRAAIESRVQLQREIEHVAAIPA